MMGNTSKGAAHHPMDRQPTSPFARISFATASAFRAAAPLLFAREDLSNHEANLLVHHIGVLAL